MSIQATPATNQAVLPLRARFREEMNCQIVKDSIHRRDGWTLSWLLELDGVAVGFGTIAIAGPWKDKPTILEFYVVPPHRARAFDLFEAFLKASGARFFEVQSSEPLLTVMLHTYGRDIVSESIVFADKFTTSLPANGAVFKRVTSEEEIRAAIERRQGGGEWHLELNGETVASGGVLFHYNRPYGDVYMDVKEPFRRRGLGAYLVQELKRSTYEFGAIPAARCNPANIASRRTLLKAGFVPCAHILDGTVRAEMTKPE